MALVQFLFHFNLAYCRIVDESVYCVSVLNLIEGSCFDYECIVYRCFRTLCFVLSCAEAFVAAAFSDLYSPFVCLCECMCECVWRL